MQELLVGPDPSVMQGIDHRFRLAIPAAYLPSDYVEQLVPGVAVSRAVFVVTLEDFSPAGDRRANGPGVLSGAISWMPQNFVKKSIDGSRLNSFSQYNVPSGDKFGLEERRTRTYDMFPQSLYVSVPQENSTMIECAYAPSTQRPQFCHMWSQNEGGPLLELFFRQDYMADWLRLRSEANQLVDQWLLPNSGEEDQ